jgi:16S rRNA (adenine1518-N6/adenine1519-N6)-dimethyltransferase
MKLSTITASLAQIGMEPTRSLGQNFLHDQNLAEWIVAQLDLKPGEAWVELGPGLGALTEFALARSSHGLVIEKDGRLAAFLLQRFPALEIVHGDATDFDVRELFARGPVKVLGNLPYYVSSQILFGFTDEPSPVSALIFTLQKELAQRLSAKPRTKEYGALTLLVGRRWRVKYLRTLPGSVFVPAPKVDSGIVLLTPRPAGEVPACDGVRFTTLVKQGFSQRRKQLRKMLASYAFDWPALCAQLGVEETTRAEELSLEQWIALTNFVTGPVAPASAAGAQDVHAEIFDVVDAADHVTSQASRHEVHRQKLLHRAVHIFVFNTRGELFLQRRSRWKDTHPLRWDSSAAGHVNTGHTYDETAPREIEEELGVQASVELLAAIAPSAATGWEHVRLFRAQHDGPFKLHPAELDGGGFFTLEQIDRWVAARPEDFASGFLECFRLFRETSASARNALTHAASLL